MIYDTRIGEPTAADTAVEALQRGASSDAGQMSVPSGQTAVVQVIVSGGTDVAAAEAGVLEAELVFGAAGTHTFIVAAVAAATGASGGPSYNGPTVYPVFIPVKEGERVRINTYMEVGDVGSGAVAVTLGFNTGPLEGGPSTPTRSISRAGTSGTVDAVATMATEAGSTSAGAMRTPTLPNGGDARRIVSVGVAMASDLAAAGIFAALVRISGSVLDGGEQFFTAGTHGGGTTTEEGGASPATVWKTDIAIKGSGDITCEVSSRGIDGGDYAAGVTLTFA